MIRRVLPLVGLLACSSSRAPELAAHRDPLSIVRAARFVVRAGSVDLPLRSVAPLRVGAGALFIDVRPLDRADVVGRRDGDAVVHPAIAPSTDVVLVSHGKRIEELRVLHDASAPTLARYRIAKGPGIASLRVREGRVEALDENQRVAVASDVAFAVDARGVRRDATVTIDGDVVGVDVDVAGLEFPVVVDPMWTTVPSMSKARAFATMDLLPSGKVLVAGGSGGSSLSDGEIYDPVANTWSSAGALVTARSEHESVALSDGRVVLFGNTVATSSVEVYEEGKGFSSLGALLVPRNQMTATLLPGGKVLVAGGRSGGAPISTAEIFDPATKTSTATAPMAVARAQHAALALPSGKVLVSGGVDPKGSALVAEIFDPATKTWTAADAGMPQRRSGFLLVALPGGKALAVAGDDGASTFGASTADVFDSATSKWSKAASMKTERTDAFAVTLASGAVLVGGSLSDASVEVYSPASNAWAAAPSLPSVLQGAVGARLKDGRVLVAGGVAVSPFGEDYFANAEIYAAGKLGDTCTTGGDCDSGACADGVCCDRACDGQCEACNVAGKQGTCTFITGDPVGSRAKCTGAAKCEGTSFVPAERCDGAGKCAAKPVDCGGFACAVTGCKTSCATASDCVAGFVCSSGRCEPEAGSTCSKDLRSAVAKDGTQQSCNGFLCDATTGRCRSSCTVSTECADGFVCGAGTCTPAPQAAGEGSDSGGCSTSARGHGGAVIALAVALAALLKRRA